MTKLNGSWADHKWLGFPLVISLSVCFLFFFYGKVLVQPNSYLFSTSGDGIKNYYTYAYHIKHDTSFHHFKGFLYPYGDLQIMTDGHPLLSWVVQLLKIPFPGIVEYSVGILNSLMLWSYLLCALTLYGLLRTYGLSRVIAAFGGFSIMILCPQFDRLYGHLSLSYAFFIPLLWLLLRKFELTDKNRYLWFLLFSSAAFYFTHPYLGVIGTFWLLLLSVVGTIHAKVTTRSFDRKRFIKSITFTIVPLVVFQLYVLALNKFKDRPLYRFDFGSTMGQLKSIFLPHHQPFVDIFKSLTGVTDQNWEAWSYVGIWTFFMLVFILVWVLFSVFQKKGYPLKGEELIILVCSIIGLVFSFGFPITSMTFLLDLVPPIRQIRVLARFSWLFYFGSGIFALVTFAKWCRSQQHGEVKVLIGAFFLVSLNFWEAFEQHNSVEKVLHTKNEFRQDLLDNKISSWIEQIKLQEAEAILFYPFYLIGGEQSTVDIANEDLFKVSQLLSYHTGLPLMNSCMSRTSHGLIDKQLELFSELYKESQLLKDVDSETKILVVAPKSVFESGNWVNLDLEAQANLNLDELSAVELPLKELLQNHQKEVVEHYLSVKDSWKQDGYTLYPNNYQIVVFETFDQWGNDTTNVFRGAKSKSGYYNDYNMIWETSSDRFKIGTTYLISFWYYLDVKERRNIMFYIDESNKEENYSAWTNVTDTRVAKRNEGNWRFVEIPFSLQKENVEIKFMLHGTDSQNPPVSFDQFLIREKGCDVYFEYQEELYKNNVPVSSIQHIYH